MGSHALTVAGDTVKGLAAATGLPGFLRDGYRGALSDQAAIVGNLLNAQVETGRKAFTAPSLSEKVGYGVATALPVLGPWAAHLGEMVSRDEGPEALAEGLLAALGPPGARAGVRATNAALPSAKRGIDAGASMVGSWAPALRTGAREAVRHPVVSAVVPGVADAALRALGAPVTVRQVLRVLLKPLAKTERAYRVAGEIQSRSAPRLELSQIGEIAAKARELSRKLILTREEELQLAAMKDRLRISAREAGLTYPAAQSPRRYVGPEVLDPTIDLNTASSPRRIEGLSKRSALPTASDPQLLLGARPSPSQQGRALRADDDISFDPKAIEAMPTTAASASAERVFMLRWLADDLREMTFERGGTTPRMRREAYEHYRPGDPKGSEYGIGPASAHVAGTPTQQMFHALGVKGSRLEIAAKIDRAIAKGDNPKLEALADALREAWDGREFDWGLITEETLARTGLRRRDLRSPITTPWPDDQPSVYARFFPERD
jgi:hypothetical protein